MHHPAVKPEEIGSGEIDVPRHSYPADLADKVLPQAVPVVAKLVAP
jgi:hypothetical protein